MKTRSKLKARTIKTTDDMWAEVKAIAEQENKATGDNVSASDVVRYAIRMLLDEVK